VLIFTAPHKHCPCILVVVITKLLLGCVLYPNAAVAVAHGLNPAVLQYDRQAQFKSATPSLLAAPVNI